uniref:GDP-fucose protein O-fucosyltransferase 2 n=1 Tax=Actinia tenebrosa TaxID=6105 RepID=A0A6P8HIW3_ACTTE
MDSNLTDDEILSLFCALYHYWLNSFDYGFLSQKKEIEFKVELRGSRIKSLPKVKNVMRDGDLDNVVYWLFWFLKSKYSYFTDPLRRHKRCSIVMSRLSPKRPNSLALQQSHSDAFVSGHFNKRRLSLTWFDLMPECSWKRVKLNRRIRKSQFIRLALVALVIIVLTAHKLPRTQLQSSRGICSNSSKYKIYVKGKRVCNSERIQSSKYFTYQPPGGGWNNQRIAFENAVIMAKLLNRTLIVHPMAPHQEIVRLKKFYLFDLGHQVYNRVSSKRLLPLSKVIDLSRLSKLLPVKEIFTNHTTFIQDNQHLSWYRVCHNGFQGLWVDSLPSNRNIKAWNALKQRANDMQLHKLKTIPTYRRSCKADMALYSSNANNTPFWGILDELSQRTENIIYFEEGSMFFRQMLFLDKKRTLDAHKWLIKFITFASPIWKRLRNIQSQIGFPFNAMHVRRTDHPTSQHISPDNWLNLLNKRGALNITSKLYVATDEKNLTWFTPFRKAGYDLMFAKDFMEELTPHSNKSNANLLDIIGLTEQLICAHAYHFVGSYYSTFSLYIKRLRKYNSWKGQLLAFPYSPVTWVDIKSQ